MEKYRHSAAAMLLAACLLGFAKPALADENPAPVPTARAYAAELHAINPRLRPAQRLDYAQTLLRNAARFDIDPLLIMALVTVESDWNATAVSWCGAFGLGQLMPDTARAIGVDRYAPQENLHGTASYLHRLFQIFDGADETKQLRETIAGYNAGPKAVQRYGGVPPYAETQHYVRKVLRTWAVLRKRMNARIAASGNDAFQIPILPVPLVVQDNAVPTGASLDELKKALPMESSTTNAGPEARPEGGASGEPESDVPGERPEKP